MVKQLLSSFYYLKKCLTLILALSISFAAYAQTVITGTVKDQKGEILPGVSIRVKEVSQV